MAGPGCSLASWFPVQGSGHCPAVQRRPDKTPRSDVILQTAALQVPKAEIGLHFLPFIRGVTVSD